MSEPLSISLSPSGDLTLHLPRPVELPMSLEGVEILHYILMQREISPKAKIGTDASPTQHIVNEWLKGEGWGEEKQLAGDPKRWKEIEERTGVRVRKFKSNRSEKLSLEDLFP